MSGAHTEASAPLDLRTTTRDITDRTTGQSKTRTPKIEEVEECTSRGSPSLSSAIKPGSKDSHGQTQVKCERLTHSDAKSPETSTSKLPIRKRPVRTDHKPQEQSENRKTDSGPSPAKVPRCSSVCNGLNAEAQQFAGSPVPGGAHSDTQLTPSNPCESEELILFCAVWCVCR